MLRRPRQWADAGLPRYPSPVAIAQPHIVLLGLRAAGKTTLARVLAARLGRRAVDLDDRTLAKSGAASIRAAFEALGEARFRALESEALAEALAEPSPLVLALGGGTPTAPGAAECLASARDQRRAYLVYLDPPLATMQGRLVADAGDRPSLTGRGVVEEIAELAAQRGPLYAALADLVLREPRDTDALAAEVERALRGA
jgi:shikimate kinase